MSSPSLAAQLTELAAWHTIERAPFRARAYAFAAELAESREQELRDAWKKEGVKGLRAFPGIGEGLAQHFQDYFTRGAIPEWRALRKRFPVEVAELLRIEGLGPKHIFTLYQALGIKTREQLKRAIQQERVRSVPGFGSKSEEKLARGIALLERSSGRHLLADALPLAESLVRQLTAIPHVIRATTAGSVRRRQETIGDIDLIATSPAPKQVLSAFLRFPEVETVLEQGGTKASVRLKNGMDADLRVVPDAVFGATLQYFTGDKRHNVLLREHARTRGFTLNEYGLFRGKTRIACATEEDIYAALGMATPPPELRVGGEEITAAVDHTLPDLLPYGAVRGDLQTQTTWTDGEATIEEMAREAHGIGRAYLAITDHTKSLAFIGGLDTKRIRAQGKEIDTLNTRRIQGCARLLKGAEVDIKRDGSLDLPDATLATLDWVGVSVHSSFTLPRATMTKRILRAIQNPHVDCLFHPTGRIIGKREPYAIDFAELLAEAKRCRVALEIDAYPDRSDLHDLHVRMAVDAGVPLVIDTDAHARSHLGYLSFGEAIARRGWARTQDIINTKTLTQLRAWLEKKRPRPHWTA